MGSDLGVSTVRTLVPVIVGLAVAWLAKAGVTIDNATLSHAIDAIAVGAYYAATRALEARWPAAGWLLGIAKAPTYTPKPGN